MYQPNISTALTWPPLRKFSSVDVYFIVYLPSAARYGSLQTQHAVHAVGDNNTPS